MPEDPLEQLDLALENLSHNLQAADMGMDDIGKLTFYLVGEAGAHHSGRWSRLQPRPTGGL